MLNLSMQDVMQGTQESRLFSQTKTQNQKAQAVELGIHILGRLQRNRLGVKRGDQESQSTARAELGEGREKLQKGFAQVCRITKEDERSCTPLMSERGHLAKTGMDKTFLSQSSPASALTMVRNSKNLKARPWRVEYRSQ